MPAAGKFILGARCARGASAWRVTRLCFSSSRGARDQSRLQTGRAGKLAAAAHGTPQINSRPLRTGFGTAGPGFAGSGLSWSRNLAFAVQPRRRIDRRQRRPERARRGCRTDGTWRRPAPTPPPAVGPVAGHALARYSPRRCRAGFRRGITGKTWLVITYGRIPGRFVIARRIGRRACFIYGGIVRWRAGAGRVRCVVARRSAAPAATPPMWLATRHSLTRSTVPLRCRIGGNVFRGRMLAGGVLGARHSIGGWAGSRSFGAVRADPVIMRVIGGGRRLGRFLGRHFGARERDISCHSIGRCSIGRKSGDVERDWWGDAASRPAIFHDAGNRRPRHGRARQSGGCRNRRQAQGIGTRSVDHLCQRPRRAVFPHCGATLYCPCW